MLAQLIVCHLTGDFILQNDFMQAKSKSSLICSLHVGVYSLPFLLLAGTVSPWAMFLILLEHWLQDRFALHLRWMRLYQQTPPEKWPAGPLCVDQAMHIAFIGLAVFLFPI